ncbi:DUF6289 family protein [Paucibacter sp. APW11]|uniref:DUF6289 family protein n=1 Tax=Roseateles aquae TaxID=3077235 RepID=A0ABU3PHB1_9BURK|nr:DUF6289 family protein [Paucibacter sp. APW11]MDT9001941.1 DUF6289 family protein [Paucibacter sp. APW11]
MKRQWIALCLALAAVAGLSAAWARPNYGFKMEFLDNQGQVVGGLSRNCLGQTVYSWGTVTNNRRLTEQWDCE